MAGIPGTRGRPWYVREAGPSLIGVGVIIFAGVAALVKESIASQPSASLITLYVLGLAAGAGVGTLNVLRAKYKDTKEDKKESPDDLRACLHVLHRMMCGFKGVTNPDDGWMRITVHRVDGAEFEQVVDYVGSGDGGSGRRFVATAGLIGAVLADATKRPLIFERPAGLPWDLWVEYLVSMLKMPRARALLARQDRFSFLAVPIRDPRGSVAAIVYGDAAQPGFFDRMTQAVFLHGCVGLAYWVNERYFS